MKLFPLSLSQRLQEVQSYFQIDEISQTQDSGFKEYTAGDDRHAYVSYICVLPA
jgi:hypothetical protein